jgi:CheY-like chemotaxis protein
LRHHGANAVCVDSGEAALAYLRLHLPKLVILDVMMPGMDGLEVLRQIRSDARTANLPVIMFTASSDDGHRAQAHGLNATDYWIKGAVDFADLERRVGAFLDK